MKKAILLLLFISLGSTALAADISLMRTVSTAGKAPADLSLIEGTLCAFDPLTQTITALDRSRTYAVPATSRWTAVASGENAIYGLTGAGIVQRWDPLTTTVTDWAVDNVVDLQFACGGIWLLYKDGRIEKRDPVSGALQKSWSEGWELAAKIHVSEALEQVCLAPIQGTEVRLYDTSGLHLRTLQQISNARCADLALGPGGVIATADRFQGVVELYGPLGDHLGQISARGAQAGQSLRPAALWWRDNELWVLDPTLARVSVYSVDKLGENVLPVPIQIGPAAGATAGPDMIRFTVLPRRMTLAPERIAVEVTTAAGEALLFHDLRPAGDADTLSWQPDFAWQRGQVYRWRVQAYAGEMQSGWSSWSVFSVAPLPQSFALLPNYPNPFNAATVVPFQVPDRAERATKLVVVNVLGQEVRTLFDGSPEPGPQSIVWDGRNDQGRLVGSGVYFIRLIHQEGALTRKVVLLK